MPVDPVPAPTLAIFRSSWIVTEEKVPISGTLPHPAVAVEPATPPLQQLRTRVIALTKEEILAAAKKHFNPERLNIVAVGAGEALPKLLSGFGEVKEIKLSPEG